MTQGNLFDGRTFVPALDEHRLLSILEAVRALMLDGRRRTLAEIRFRLGRGTEASISARLRDLRKPRFGALAVQRARRGDPKAGLWEYWVQ